jgi:putative endonuclease
MTYLLIRALVLPYFIKQFETRGSILSKLNQMKQPAVYILASQARGTLYIGVTSDLIKRVYQHKNNLEGGFTKQHLTHTLVHYELFGDMYEAIRREKQLKKWKRVWKLELIEENNSSWKDLYDEIV